MTHSKYKITVTSSGDKIRHRVATIVLDGNGNTLVDMNGWMWCPEFPGGGVDAEETTLTAASRELMEEAGWLATDAYIYSYPGDWVYRVPHSERKDTQMWNCEANEAVICKADGFKPTSEFGSEGDVLKCKMIPIPEVITALKKRLAGGMQARHRIKNEMILGILEELIANNSKEPKWAKW